MKYRIEIARTTQPLMGCELCCSQNTIYIKVYKARESCYFGQPDRMFYFAGSYCEDCFTDGFKLTKELNNSQQYGDDRYEYKTLEEEKKEERPEWDKGNQCYPEYGLGYQSQVARKEWPAEKKRLEEKRKKRIK